MTLRVQDLKANLKSAIKMVRTVLLFDQFGTFFQQLIDFPLKSFRFGTEVARFGQKKAIISPVFLQQNRLKSRTHSGHERAELAAVANSQQSASHSCLGPKWIFLPLSHYNLSGKNYRPRFALMAEAAELPLHPTTTNEFAREGRRD